MDKVTHKFRKFLFITACLCCIGITCYNIYTIPLNVHGKIFLVDEYVDTYYEMLSDNVGLTTINGISNVYVNMKQDGYSIFRESVTDNFIDVSFVKEGEPSYRFYFTYPECKITIFSSDYEKSYLGCSYIFEYKK